LVWADGSGFELRQGRDFPHLFRLVPRPIHPPLLEFTGRSVMFTHSHMAPGLKKGQGCTFTPLLAFIACYGMKLIVFTVLIELICIFSGQIKFTCYSLKEFVCHFCGNMKFRWKLENSRIASENDHRTVG
jgi:hypothetical protein